MSVISRDDRQIGQHGVVNPGTQKRQLQQQHNESKWRNREGIKRSQRTNQRISYEECEDDIDEFNQSKHGKYGVNCLLGQCNCSEVERKKFPVLRLPGSHTNDESNFRTGSQNQFRLNTVPVTS